MSNILITGYSGFVGGILVDNLKNNYQLRLLGRKPSPIAKVYSYNIDQHSVYHDALVNINTLVHCAARVHMMDDSISNCLSEFRAINTVGTLNLARQASQAGVKRFIFLSSIKVNGETTSNKAAFSVFDKRLPQDPYAVSKSEAEEQLLALGRETGMEIVIIRPPLVYGKGVKANFYSLMKLVKKGFPLPFRLINRNKRSLVSVYNLVDLISLCITHPKAAGQVFLVSDDNDLSTSAMVALMANVQGKANLSLPIPIWCLELVGKVLNKQAVVDRLVGSLQLDIQHTKTTLGWTPPYTVEDGFKLAVSPTA